MSVFGNLFGTKKKRAFFEGARRTKVNRDFANASDQPFEKLAITDRDTMRARARWLSANNPIMSNIDATITANVIGSGIKLQADGKIEDAFNTWAKTCDLTGRMSFYDMQRILLKTRMVDGEAFIYKKITKDGLKLQLIEADQLDTYKGESGITLDDDGKPKMYHFKSGSESVDIAAEHIINYYKPIRISQYRGVSEYSQSIIDIKNFSAFVSANIESLRARANVAYAVYGEEDPGLYGGTTEDDEKIQTVNSAMVYYLSGASKIEALDSHTTPVNFKEFVDSTVRMLATARNISYELAYRDFSQVNFSSARASIIQDNKRFDAEQQHMIEKVLDDIFKTWYETEILSGRIAESVPVHQWITPAREWVQPDKDLKVALDKVANNLAAPEDIARALGQDYEETLRRKRANLDLAKNILGEFFTGETI